MRHLFQFFSISALSILLCACATDFRPSAQFTAPSVEPVRAEISRAQTSLTTAQSHAAKAKSAIAAARQEVSALPNLPASLSADLTSAGGEVDQLTKNLLEAQTSLTNSQTEIANLQTQIVGLTKSANQVVAEKNAAISQLAKCDADRKRMVKQRDVLFLVLLAAVAWIFRGPLLALVRLAGPLVGIPI